MIDEKTIDAAWGELRKSVIEYQGRPVGTVAARDPDSDALNYDQCFTRDFAVSALAFLMHGETDIVRNFLSVMVELQSKEKHMNCFKAGQGLMPASFAVIETANGALLKSDFGEHAIARVAPVDSGFWWLILLCAYTRASGDVALAQRPEFQQAIKLILELCLEARFDMYPTLLVPDGAYMIDRRMGVYGYPFDIQSLFFSALSAALELLPGDAHHHTAVTERLAHLGYHLRRYYWLDFARLNDVYRYQVEEYGSQIINCFNIQPSAIPPGLAEWIPASGGYFTGNVGPGRMDFRYFAQGNLLAVISSLATPDQAQGIMDLIEQRWDDLVGEMPLKICFPALKGRDWKTVTGSDPKNIPWSYHNGGNWPVLLWLLAAAAQKTGRPELAARALQTAAGRLETEHWAEYFDGRHGRLVGKEARHFQTWTVAGFLAAHQLLEQPAHLGLLGFESRPTDKACDWLAEQTGKTGPG
jgi:glycogen debranching enzyme